MSDRLKGQRHAVIDEWVFHVDLSSSAFRCWAVLRLHTNGETAFPSRRSLAALMQCSTNTVDRAMAELHGAGLVQVEPRSDERGDRTSNLYRLVSGPASPSPPMGTPSPPMGRPPPHPWGDPLPTHGEAVTNNLNTQTEQLATLARAVPINAPVPVPLSQLPELDPFLEFWATYPRRHGKGDARKAWDKVRKTTPVEAILEGARRFRDDPNLPEPEFIPHPSTWLNQARWEDDPLPPRNGAGDARTLALKRYAATPQAAGLLAIEISRQRREAHESDRS